MLRSATVVLLLLSMAAFGQPLPNPFVAYQSDSGSLTSPRLTMRDSAVADVFWIRRVDSDGEQYTEHAVVSLTSRQLVSGPDVLQHTLDWAQQIGDVISRGQEGWAAVLYEDGRPAGYAMLSHRMFFSYGADNVQTAILVDSMTQDVIIDCYGWSNSDMRLVERIGGGWIVSWIRNGCRSNGSWWEPENSIALASLSANFAEDDSIVCCGGDYFQGPERACAVSTDHDSVVTLSLNYMFNGQPEPYGPYLRWQSLDGNVSTIRLVGNPWVYWDLRRTRGGRLLALSAPGGGLGYNYPLLVELHRSGDPTVLDTLPYSYSPVAFHPDYGFAILSISGPFILLSRIDTSGAEVQPLGVFYTADPGRLIPEASVTIADNGRVVVLWTERDDDVGMTPDAKMAWVDWSTFLGTSERPSVPKPSSISLSSYPNPFNSELRIEYALPKAQNVELSVYNLLGQKVATLFDGMKMAGPHEALWTPQCGTGIYFVTLKTSESVRTTKVAYLR